MSDQQEQPRGKWGDPISEERRTELRGMLAGGDAPGADHGDRKGPFDSVWLTGADVFWLAEQSGRIVIGDVPDLHLAGANLSGAHLEGAGLSEAHLERANLSGAHLAGANLSGAHLAGASLIWAHLEGADLGFTLVEGADLSGASFDGETTLAYARVLSAADDRHVLARLLRRPRYGPALGDISWGDFDLLQLSLVEGWDDLRRLADERGITWRSDARDQRDAVRAYRQVTQRLRDLGFSDIADRLADRAQVLQRTLQFRLLLDDVHRPWRLPGDLMRWLFSWFLALVAGYGYHPGRSVFWYVATIGCFAFLFVQATHGVSTLGVPASNVQPLAWYEALVLSVSSFHGRGFFPPTGPNGLGDPVAILAAGEAVFGLLIEITFIATFTQRFVGAK